MNRHLHAASVRVNSETSPRCRGPLMKALEGLTTLVWLTVIVASPSRASTPGSDDASSSAYSGGWTNGSNGGTTFQAWSLTPTNSGSGQGFFVGSSTGNGGGDSGNDGDINVSSKAWGFYSNNGVTTEAIRKFK